MKRMARYAIALVAGTMLSAPLFATNGMRMIGFGPVQRSMGGASVGVALDAASMLTNPAGMSGLNGRVDFGASYFSPAVEYRAVETPGFGGMIVPNSSVYHSDRGASPIPALGVIIPISDDLHFGIGAYGIAGMGVDYKVNLYGNQVSSAYSQMRFAPGVSYKINEMISIGVTLNVMYATMEFNAGPPAIVPAANFPQQAHLGAAAMGVGATLGVMIKPVTWMSVGLSYETRSWFQDFVFNTRVGTDRIDFDQPQSATIGFGFTPLEGLVLGFDVQWIHWAETNGKNKPSYVQNRSFALPWNLNWTDQFVYKFGVQYALGPVDVRAGYNYGKMPLDENRAFENIAFPAVSEHHITLGFGIHFNEKFTLNVGTMYSPKASITGSNFLPPPMGQGVGSYRTSMSQYSIDLGLAYRF